MKEVREQQLCDHRRQIEEKHRLEEIEMETIKQKIEGQSNQGYRSGISSPNSN